MHAPSMGMVWYSRVECPTRHSICHFGDGSSATLTNPGIYALGQLMRQASALMRERGHAPSRIVNSELQVYVIIFTVSASLQPDNHCYEHPC